MGITLLTNRGRLSGDRVRRSADRWTLIRRGVLLYAFGFVFEWVWSGTILFFYGAFFVAGAVLFTLRTRWLIVDRRGGRNRRRGTAVVGVRDRPRHQLALRAAGTRQAHTGRRGGCCSTPSSTARTPCCHGWRSCAPAWCSVDTCPLRAEWRRDARSRSASCWSPARTWPTTSSTAQRCSPACSPPIRSAAASTTRCAPSVRRSPRSA